MQGVLAVTGPIYLIIAVGWVVTRGGLFDRSDMRVFGKFVLQLALPALLFNSLWQRTASSVLNPVFLAAFGGASVLVIVGGLAWARLVEKKSLSAAAVMTLGMSCGNNGFVGYPLALQLLGPVAGAALALCLIVENVFVLPLLLALADAGQGDMEPVPGRWRRAMASSVRLLVRNPMIIAIAAGLAFSLLGLRLPAPVARAIDLFAAASGGLALFVIGGSLAGLRTPGLWREIAAEAVAK